MALGDNYATAEELKRRLNIPVNNTDYDGELDDALDSASREIERFTNRQFNKQVTATARVFEPFEPDYVWITDFWEADEDEGFKIETHDGASWVQWDPDDYEVYPRDNQEFGVSGFPFYKIFPIKFRYFPKNCRGDRRGTLRVTAKWGWNEVPSQVKQGTLALAARNFQMKDAPLGLMAGGSEFGPVRVQDDKFVSAKLQGLRRCGGLRVA